MIIIKKLTAEQVQKLQDDDCVYITVFTSKGNIKTERWVLIDWITKGGTYYLRTSKGNKISEDIDNYNDYWNVQVCEEIYLEILNR